MNDKKNRIFICQRLQRLGFASGGKSRLYGEEFDFISDPISETRGYSIVGVSRKSGNSRRVSIPLSIVQTIEHELLVFESTARAA
jgi:hypothetical protein